MWYIFIHGLKVFLLLVTCLFYGMQYVCIIPTCLLIHVLQSIYHVCLPCEWIFLLLFLLLLLSLLDCIMYMFAVLMKCYIRPMFWYYTVLHVLRVIWLLILITFLHYRIYKCGFLLSHMSAFAAVFICAFKDMYHAHTHTRTLLLSLF